jgi:pimeloyl-ACP methyl ester carboxylesterase
LCEYWRDQYDWRRCESKFNDWGQFATDIDGVTIQFAHIRSTHADALPMIMTHGWPGSIMEFHKIIDPLVDPTAHGGRAEDAFHLVLPSIPGYGFSGKPRETGWNLSRVAHAWSKLMHRLGYDRYVAQGGDWGAMITHQIALQQPPGCIAAHANLSLAFPAKPDPITEAEYVAVKDRRHFQKWEGGYAAIQSTRPQTIGYGLVDSPVLLSAWIYEKFHAWADIDSGVPEDMFSYDEILDNIMLYWLPAAGASAARFYWESYHTAFRNELFEMPFGLSIFPHEVMRPSRRWAEPSYRKLIYWNEVEAGGHFAAFEQPAIFVREMRNWLRALRTMDG